MNKLSLSSKPTLYELAQAQLEYKIKKKLEEDIAKDILPELESRVRDTIRKELEKVTIETIEQLRHYADLFDEVRIRIKIDE